VTIEKMQMNQKLTSCSVLARFHHTAKRAMLGGSVRIMTPVVGAATSSPVIGDTMRGM
jgi:hypothetical protein